MTMTMKRFAKIAENGRYSGCTNADPGIGLSPLDLLRAEGLARRARPLSTRHYRSRAVAFSVATTAFGEKPVSLSPEAGERVGVRGRSWTEPGSCLFPLTSHPLPALPFGFAQGRQGEDDTARRVITDRGPVALHRQNSPGRFAINSTPLSSDDRTTLDA